MAVNLDTQNACMEYLKTAFESLTSIEGVKVERLTKSEDFMGNGVRISIDNISLARFFYYHDWSEEVTIHLCYRPYYNEKGNKNKNTRYQVLDTFGVDQFSKKYLGILTAGITEFIDRIRAERIREAAKKHRGDEAKKLLDSLEIQYTETTSPDLFRVELSEDNTFGVGRDAKGFRVSGLRGLTEEQARSILLTLKG